MSASVTGARSELGRLLARARVRRGVHFNVAGQQANTLLHDGHAWKGFARAALAGVRRALRAEADLLVHASCAFVLGRPGEDPLRSIAQTILECERLALSGPAPACVVRLGYLYGPESADLRAYRKAFRLGRPYWAGARKALQYHLHQDDAVSALLAAAQPRNAGKMLYATDGKPVSFMQLMDEFARKVGRRVPLHVPRLAAPVMRLIVRAEHMQQAAAAMPPRAPAPRVPGWKPRFADYRAGLDATLATVTHTTFCRGDGGFSVGDGATDTAPSPPSKVPERAPDLVRDIATLPQQALLYRLCADRNPLHSEPAAARKAGFDRPILHGLGTFGVAGHALLAACCEYDPARLRSMFARFSAPVFPGETIRVEIYRDGDAIAFRARVKERDKVVLDYGRAARDDP